uniref:ShKT domain-containing protein n=1 Tax=Steinernema glaseri TaxID=37863 RepID=A0A1I8AB13_9BILA
MLRLSLILLVVASVVQGWFFDRFFHAEAPSSAENGTTIQPTLLRCADANGMLFPNATSCPNLSPDKDCEFFFKPTADGGRNPKCDQDILQVAAMKCARTCAICCELPEFQCEDKFGYSFLCPVIKRNCNTDNEVMRKVFAEICPKTCGFCGEKHQRDVGMVI